MQFIIRSLVVIRMVMLDIEINGACRTQTRIIGKEKTPVITLDEPIVSTDTLIEYAMQRADFGPSGEAYPGIRADLPVDYPRALMPGLVGLISHVYNIPRSFRPYLIHQLFSLVTRQPEDLGLLQRMPHTDDRNPYYFASVHYLTEGNHAGTGFFRHRPTQFERITEDIYEPFKQAAMTHMEANGQPAQKYINASDDQFELIGEIEHKPNRMAVYPGNLLHSGLINPDRDVSDDPAKGRLTANLFILFAPT